MAAQRREVRHSESFLEQARIFFPPGGSSDGRPSFELFTRWPLSAADELFSRSFDELPEIAPGIRGWLTLQTPFFPPIVFYAVLVVDYVEIVSLTVDEDYWDLMEDDPD